MKMEDPGCRTKTQHSQINKQIVFFFFLKQEKRDKDKQEGKVHRKTQSTILSDIVENQSVVFLQIG